MSLRMAALLLAASITKVNLCGVSTQVEAMANVRGEYLYVSFRSELTVSRHHLCIQPPKAERHVVPRMLPPATREREDMKLPRAYLEQLSSQCINTQWHLDSLRHQSAHDFACLRDKYEQLVNAHSELQHHHNLFAKKHDCLIDITIMLCNEMQLHASVMKELNDWRLQSENARSTVSTGYDSPEFILHASPSTTPVCEIHLPEVESHCAPLNSPASSASAPPSPRIGTSDNAADPTLFLKLRCLQSEKGTDAEQTSMESHRELCLAPPDSATMDPSETNEVENLINGIQNDDELGAKERRRSTRGTKPSVKRRNQVHPGVPKKRSKA